MLSNILGGGGEGGGGHFGVKFCCVVYFEGIGASHKCRFHSFIHSFCFPPSLPPYHSVVFQVLIIGTRGQRTEDEDRGKLGGRPFF